VSDQVSAGVRTIVATRALNTGDANDHIFAAATGSLSLIWARSGSATFSYSYHGASNRGVSTANFTLVPPPPPPAAPTGSAAQTFCSGALLSQLSASGTAIQWYASATGGTPLNGTSVLINGTTYYASQTVNGVESINRLAVTAIINTAPNAPAPIVGDVHFCHGSVQAFSINAVANASTYVWSTPNGSTGNSTGTTINLLFSPSFTNGTLSVVAQNSCGQSPSSSVNIFQHFPSTNTQTVATCNNFTFNGQTYTQSGTYSFQDTTIWGCDSVVVLNLTIANEILTNLSAEACGSYNWNNQSYFVSGNYVDSLQSTSGCDSIVVLNLVVNPITSLTVDSTVFDSFQWNGQVYATSGQYTQFFTSIHGCDSTVTINLTILDSGLDDISHEWGVYPNPLTSNQCLFISGLSNGSFQLFDLKGMELRSGEFTGQIDLNGISKGMYLLKIANQSTRISIP
jgi:hypothetical protein